MQNLVTIPQGVPFPHMCEIAHQKCLLGFFFIWVLLTPHSRGPQTEFHAKYVKRRDSAQECAFSELENKHLAFKPPYS